MEMLPRAVAIIRLAEQQLRELLSEAANSGEYDSLLTLGEWAKQLASLTAAFPAVPDAEGDSAIRHSSPIASPHVRLSGPQQAPTGNGASPARRVKGKRLRRRHSRDSEYPKFLRRNDELVKIGWSKSDKTTYEHKAPRSVVALLVQALTKVGQGGRLFTMDDILPLKQPGGGEIPSYQAYLTLAWIRAESLITQHGRQGYSLMDGLDLESETERRWSGLPTRMSS